MQRFAAIGRLGEWGTAVLASDEKISQLAQRYLYMKQCVVLGRGYNYATAFEWSLKLKELTYVVAEPYSSADFRHGPIAIVERGFPIMAIAPTGAVLADMRNLLQKLAEEKQAELLIMSNDDDVDVSQLAHCAARRPARMAVAAGEHHSGAAFCLPPHPRQRIRQGDSTWTQ